MVVIIIIIIIFIFIFTPHKQRSPSRPCSACSVAIAFPRTAPVGRAVMDVCHPARLAIAHSRHGGSVVIPAFFHNGRANANPAVNTTIIAIGIAIVVIVVAVVQEGVAPWAVVGHEPALVQLRERVAVEVLWQLRLWTPQKRRRTEKREAREERGEGRRRRTRRMRKQKMEDGRCERLCACGCACQSRHFG